MNPLVKAGLLCSERGSRGGYTLARSTKDYSIGEIIRIFEGNLMPIPCTEVSPNRCARYSLCPTVGFWEGLGKVINDYVDNVTLDDLIGAFIKYYQRKQQNRPLQTKVTENEISVTSRCHDIRRLLKEKKKVSFFELFPVITKEYIVVTFLAILEMAKNQEIDIIQNNSFDDIICEVSSNV